MSKQWDGRPENPERDGWHFLRHIHQPADDLPLVRLWEADGTEWPDYDYDLAGVAARYRYLGPCLTPAEVEARVAAAQREGIEQALETARKSWPRAHTYASENADLYRTQDRAVDHVLAAIRALLEGGR